jgi:hypothetical protein
MIFFCDWWVNRFQNVVLLNRMIWREALNEIIIGRKLWNFNQKFEHLLFYYLKTDIYLSAYKLVVRLFMSLWDFDICEECINIQTQA